MIRKAFCMEVKPGKIDEYEKSHNPISPELHAILKNHGIRNYSIYHHKTSNTLFGYMEIEDEAKFNAIAQTDTCRKWWRHMKKFLVSDSKDNVKAREDELREVFHME